MLKHKLMIILTTGFGSGYCPVAPGTAGTLVGMLIYFAEYLILGPSCRGVHAVLVLVMIYPSVKIGDAGERHFGGKDPQQVVFDEVMGYWISVFLHPFSWGTAVLAFVLFRIFDIIKPFPARNLERLKGGLGIMIDDYIAGLYTNATLVLVMVISKYFNFSLF